MYIKKIMIIIISIAFLSLCFFYTKPLPGANSIFEFINIDNILDFKKKEDFVKMNNEIKYPRRLRFSVSSYLEPEKMLKKGHAIKEYFELNTSVEVKIIVSYDNFSLIDILKAGRVEIVWAGPSVFKNLKGAIDYNLLLKVMRSKNFSTGENMDIGIPGDVMAKTRIMPDAPILINNNVDLEIRTRIYELLISPLKYPGGEKFINILNELEGIEAFSKADTNEYEI